MKKIIQKILKIFAGFILLRYQPMIIGITGSVGKTTTKEAVYTILSGNFKVRASQKNYNNEIGLPLTIIGEETKGKSIYGWLKVFLKSAVLCLIKDKDYPEILILEMGVDRPGDMEYFNDMLDLNIGIITTIGHSHLENFGSVERIRKEKGKMIAHIRRGGTAIINYDNEESRKIMNISKVKTLTYGFDEKAGIRAVEPQFKVESLRDKIVLKTIFKIHYAGSYVPVVLENTLAKSRVYSVLAGAGAALSLGLNLMDVADAMKNFTPPKGRLFFIPGLNDSIIVDDTYNASPESAKEALDALDKINLSVYSKKIAIFGDMLELGNYEREGHEKIGKNICECGYAYILTVGKLAEIIHDSASACLSSGQIAKHFARQEDLINYAKKIITTDNLILIKGSQGARMEKIVKTLMKNPEDAAKLLVRQGEEWQAK
jgi:UDP-N-acetylmuramoyl-tripeptide--D-alanyl-D-alanine ligase